MERKRGETGQRDKGDNREARLKQALKANLQRRKAQARARAAEDVENDKDKNGG